MNRSEYKKLRSHINKTYDDQSKAIRKLKNVTLKWLEKK